MNLAFPVENEGELRSFGRTLGQNLAGGEVIELVGPLGAGKTTLAKAILAGAGIKLGFSPTFVLNATFPVTGRGMLREIHHLDLYRLKEASELTNLGLYDIIGRPQAAVLIEWADRFPELGLKDKITIEITPPKRRAGSRTIRITGNENLWQNLSGNFPAKPKP